MPDPIDDPDRPGLATRAGLPDAIRALLDAAPEGGWGAHPGLSALTRFWLDRHVGFRDLMTLLAEDADARLAGRLDPDRHAARLARLGSHLLQGLEGHHQIEDHHYFPRLETLSPSLTRGFALLDADHHELHDRLDAFARDANAVLRAEADAAERFRDGLAAFDAMLRRHLTDEEDVIVPILLRHGDAAVEHARPAPRPPARPRPP